MEPRARSVLQIQIALVLLGEIFITEQIRSWKLFGMEAYVSGKRAAHLSIACAPSIPLTIGVRILRICANRKIQRRSRSTLTT